MQLKKLLEEDDQFAGSAAAAGGDARRHDLPGRAHGSSVVVQGKGNTVVGSGGVVKGDVKGDISTGAKKQE